MPKSGDLSQLKEIVTPMGVYETAPGIIVLIIICVISVVYVTYFSIKSYRENTYRRVALMQLNLLKESIKSQKNKCLRELPNLVKCTAFEAYRSYDVAALSGDAWLSFLKKTCSRVRVQNLTVLNELAYGTDQQLNELSDGTIGTLLSQIELWIKHHKPVFEETQYD
ncbi:MAG: DUF4381 domain-containing protein [Lentisphaeraceae bacterium]|nr:DUF4381 domain-containing protein [Lentisphaeraceae bacterium]